MATTYFDTVKSPLGEIKIVASKAGLVSIRFIGENDPPDDSDWIPNKIIKDTKKQLREYFSGKRKNFNLPMDYSGTEFQQSVWHEITKIPFGEICTYSKIAWLMGNNQLARAVGTTTGKNPVAIIIPCHRVVGLNGALTGYAGGLWRKQWLLEFENQDKLF